MGDLRNGKNVISFVVVNTLLIALHFRTRLLSWSDILPRHCNSNSRRVDRSKTVCSSPSLIIFSSVSRKKKPMSVVSLYQSVTQEKSACIIVKSRKSKTRSCSLDGKLEMIRIQLAGTFQEVINLQLSGAANIVHVTYKQLGRQRNCRQIHSRRPTAAMPRARCSSSNLGTVY